MQHTGEKLHQAFPWGMEKIKYRYFSKHLSLKPLTPGYNMENQV
jgi:hypothetical protein